LKRLFAVKGFRDDESVMLQIQADETYHTFLIVNDKDFTPFQDFFRHVHSPRKVVFNPAADPLSKSFRFLFYLFPDLLQKRILLQKIKQRVSR
jgi:hypothetical protein